MKQRKEPIEMSFKLSSSHGCEQEGCGTPPFLPSEAVPCDITCVYHFYQAIIWQKEHGEILVIIWSKQR